MFIIFLPLIPLLVVQNIILKYVILNNPILVNTFRVSVPILKAGNQKKKPTAQLLLNLTIQYLQQNFEHRMLDK